MELPASPLAVEMVISPTCEDTRLREHCHCSLGVTDPGLRLKHAGCKAQGGRHSTRGQREIPRLLLSTVIHKKQDCVDVPSRSGQDVHDQENKVQKTANINVDKGSP